MRTTDVNYADMVNPYVRAEEEAYKRGQRDGVSQAVIAIALLIIFCAAVIS